MFQKVVYKGGESETNDIKIFHNDKALTTSVVNSYTEYHPMHTFLDNFHKGVKYAAEIAIHQAYLRR